MNQSNQALTGIVKGRVQGVFFRAETQRMAQQLGLSGWCRNTSAGHVEVLIAGSEPNLKKMQAWLTQGPELARVDSAELENCDDPGLASFEIRY
ncbi:MAG: acylphosphatase [Pseudomonadales bacterium]|nr:acylphosphatase [Pseudomonadales bacterium]